MNTILVATEPFEGYARGAAITDADRIAAVLAGSNAHRVVRVTSGVPVIAAPAPVAAAPSAQTALAEAEAALKQAEAAVGPAHT
jgi:hypothetical protein